MPQVTMATLQIKGEFLANSHMCHRLQTLNADGKGCNKIITELGSWFTNVVIYLIGHFSTNMAEGAEN